MLENYLTKMNDNKIIVFTDRFPYGNSESFFASELDYISQEFREVMIWPMDSAGNIYKKRITPQNVIIKFPPFSNYKSAIELCIKGVFNKSPLMPFVSEFFSNRCWKSISKFRNWATFFLVTRKLLSSFNQEILLNNFQKDTILYFYWGLRWSQIISFLPVYSYCKIIVRFHGSDLYEELNRNYIPFRKDMLHRVDAVICISEIGQKYLVSKYPFVKDKCIIARLGTKDFGLNRYRKTNKIHIVSCSNLVSLKRVHLIAQSLKLLSIPIKWTHLGDGLEKYRIITIANSFPSNIELNLTGAISHEGIMEFYSTESIDLFINVSISEGVPVSVMEALSFGIPIIATDVGGTKEIVNNEVGLLLKSNFDPEELSNSIKMVVSKPDYLRYREKARFQWEMMSDANLVFPKFVTYLKTLCLIDQSLS